MPWVRPSRRASWRGARMATRDYEEFIAAFNGRGVRYLVAGAHAVAFHARPRATKDLDLFVEPTKANAELVLAALRDFFGGADLGYEPEDVLDPGCVIQIGVAPVRIDVMCALDGIDEFDAAWQRRSPGRFGQVETSYLGLSDLILAKEAAGRDQDRADLGPLRRAAARHGGRDAKPRR